MKSIILILCFGANAMHHKDHTLMVTPAKSEIVWKGSKKFVEDMHTGTIKLKSGQMTFQKGVPVKGSFVIDMNSIKNTDMEDEGDQKKLIGHLKSEDFFAVEQFKTAKFSFNKAKSLGENQFALTGEMEIRGTKKPETIQAVIAMNEDGFMATADAVIDRAKYGVAFNSEEKANSDDWFLVRWFKGTAGVAKDKIIRNDMSISIKLVAEK